MISSRSAVRTTGLVVGAVVLLVPACTGSDSDPGAEDGGASAPSSVSAEIDNDDGLVVSFEAVGDADAYLLHLAGHDEPIRIESDQCADGACSVTLDRLSAADADEVTVSALSGEVESEPSAAVEVPAWPEPERQPESATPPANEPIDLLVSEVDAEGRPTVRTVTVPAGQDVEARIGELRQQDGVAGVSVAEPIIEDEGGFSTDGFPAGLATWQVEAMDFDALPAEPRGEGVTVAVIDDGITATHPNLDQADITETNVVEPGRDTPGEHGTAVTSLIVGEHSGLVPGIATGAAIRVHDVYNDGGEQTGGVGALAEAIVAAVDDGAQVINISLTARCAAWQEAMGSCPDEVLRPAVEYAENRDVVVVASAGNTGDGSDWCPGGGNETGWPAAFESVIAVGGTARDGSVWPCSPDVDYVDVLAPAAHLRAAVPPDEYQIVSGTSFSAPLVSGLIAVALAERPDLTPADVRTALSSSVAENGRLIATAFLQALNIELSVESPIDPTTAQQIVPFSLGLYLPPKSEVWRRAGLANSPLDPAAYSDGEAYYDDAQPPEDAFYPWRSAGLEWGFDDPFTVLIGGLLLIDADGNVTGTGHLQPHEYYTGHRVECPRPGFGIGTPWFSYRWDVPVTVSGHVAEDDVGRDVGELTLSLGEEATAQERGKLPDIKITHDTLDDCETVLAEYEAAWQDPGHPWSEVKTWPDKSISVTEPVYRQIILESPFVIAEGFFPPTEPDTPDSSVYTSGGTLADGVGFRLRVGDIDFAQLS